MHRRLLDGASLSTDDYWRVTNGSCQICFIVNRRPLASQQLPDLLRFYAGLHLLIMHTLVLCYVYNDSLRMLLLLFLHIRVQNRALPVVDFHSMATRWMGKVRLRCCVSLTVSACFAFHCMGHLNVDVCIAGNSERATPPL